MNKTLGKWEIHKPQFEFTKELPIESSAWSGHYFFAYDLVANTKPNVIVELGTHKGNSLFSFAQAIKDLNFETELHGVDTWEGDEHAGFYGEEVYEIFLEIKDKYYKDVNIIPHKMLFDEAVEKFDDNTIDILHIDGLHTYEAVKHDFETWLPKVKKDTGIIVLHDVCEKANDFGVYKLWEELKKKYKTVTFEHYHGLGVLFLKEIVSTLKTDFFDINLLPQYYQKTSKLEDLKNINKEKEQKIQLLTNKNNSLKERNKNLKEQNDTLESKKLDLIEDNNNLIEVNNNLLEDKENLKKIVAEFDSFRRGYIWKSLIAWRKTKSKIRKIFNKK